MDLAVFLSPPQPWICLALWEPVAKWSLDDERVQEELGKTVEATQCPPRFHNDDINATAVFLDSKRLGCFPASDNRSAARRDR